MHIADLTLFGLSYYKAKVYVPISKPEDYEKVITRISARPVIAESHEGTDGETERIGGMRRKEAVQVALPLEDLLRAATRQLGYGRRSKRIDAALMKRIGMLIVAGRILRDGESIKAI